MAEKPAAKESVKTRALGVLKNVKAAIGNLDFGGSFVGELQAEEAWKQQSAKRNEENAATISRLVKEGKLDTETATRLLNYSLGEPQPDTAGDFKKNLKQGVKDIAQPEFFKKTAAATGEALTGPDAKQVVDRAADLLKTAEPGVMGLAKKQMQDARTYLGAAKFVVESILQPAARTVARASLELARRVDPEARMVPEGPMKLILGENEVLPVEEANQFVQNVMELMGASHGQAQMLSPTLMGVGATLDVTLGGSGEAAEQAAKAGVRSMTKEAIEESVKKALTDKAAQLGRELTEAETKNVRTQVFRDLKAPKAPTTAVAAEAAPAPLPEGVAGPVKPPKVRKRYDLVPPEGQKLKVYFDRKAAEASVPSPDVRVPERGRPDFSKPAAVEKPTKYNGRVIIEFAVPPEKKAAVAAEVVSPEVAYTRKMLADARAGVATISAPGWDPNGPGREAVATQVNELGRLIGNTRSDNPVLGERLWNAVKRLYYREAGMRPEDIGVLREFFSVTDAELEQRLLGNENAAGQIRAQAGVTNRPKTPSAPPELDLDKVGWTQIRTITEYDQNGKVVRTIEGPANAKKIPESRTYYAGLYRGTKQANDFAALQREFPKQVLEQGQDKLTTPLLDTLRANPEGVVDIAAMEAKLGSKNLSMTRREKEAFELAVASFKRDQVDEVPFDIFENRVQSNLKPFRFVVAGNAVKDGKVAKAPRNASHEGSQTIPSSLRGYEKVGYAEVIHGDVTSRTPSTSSQHSFAQSATSQGDGTSDLYGWTRMDLAKDPENPDGPIVAFIQEEQNDKMQKGVYRKEIDRLTGGLDEAGVEIEGQALRVAVLDHLAENPELLFSGEKVGGTDMTLRTYLSTSFDEGKLGLTREDMPSTAKNYGRPNFSVDDDIRSLIKELDNLAGLAAFGITAQPRAVVLARTKRAIEVMRQTALDEQKALAIEAKAKAARNTQAANEAKRFLDPLQQTFIQPQVSETLNYLAEGGVKVVYYPDGLTNQASGRNGVPTLNYMDLPKGKTPKTLKTGDIVKSRDGKKSFGVTSQTDDRKDVYLTEVSPDDVITLTPEAKVAVQGVIDRTMSDLKAGVRLVVDSMKGSGTATAKSFGKKWLAGEGTTGEHWSVLRDAAQADAAQKALQAMYVKLGRSKQYASDMSQAIGRALYSSDSESLESLVVDTILERGNVTFFDGTGRPLDNGRTIFEQMKMAKNTTVPDSVVSSAAASRQQLRYDTRSVEELEEWYATRDNYKAIFGRYQYDIPQWLKKAGYDFEEYIDSYGLRWFKVKLTPEMASKVQARNEEEKKTALG